MKRRLLDFSAILFITLMLALGANRIMDLWLFKLAFPESIALQDVYWEDFVFKLRPHTKQEERIVLVNVAAGGRREIAQQISKISEYNPRVIGVVIFFNCFDGKRDSINCPQLLDRLGNEMLQNAIRNSGKVVMVSKLLQKQQAAKNYNEEIYDSMEHSDDIFIRNAHHGFGDIILHANFRESIDNGIAIEVREISPQMKVNGKRELSLAVQIAMLYDSVKTLRFLERNRDHEWINFRGNVTPYNYYLGSRTITKPPYFRSVDIDSLANGLLSENIFKDKIVIVGYLGDYLNDPAYESRFYTPLNSTFAGRSMPDMLGLVVHANFVSMILNEDYIDELNQFFTWLMTLIIIVLNIIFFTSLHNRQSVWYDSLCFIVPVFQIVLFSWLRMELMEEYNFIVNFEAILYLVAFVSFSVNLYYGPFSTWRKKNLKLAKPKKELL